VADKIECSPGPFLLHHDDDGTIGIYAHEPDWTAGPQIASVLTENCDDPALAIVDAQVLAASWSLLQAAEYVEQFLRTKTLPPVTLETLRKRLAAAIAEARDPEKRCMVRPGLPPAPKGHDDSLDSKSKVGKTKKQTTGRVV